MKYILIFLIGFIPVFDPNNCLVPNSVNDILKKNEISIVDKSKLIRDWATYLTTACPTIVLGDFNGDGEEDYAIIGEGDNFSQPYGLFIIEFTEDGFKLIKIMDIGFGIYSGGLGFGMKIIERGKINGIHKTINIKNDAIFFTKFESSSKVIYYENGIYQEVWTGD